jgi:anti-sigma factor RsiW
VETVMAHAISQAAPYYKAPFELRERIQGSLRDAIGVTTSRGAPGAASLAVRRPEAMRRGVFFDVPWNWLALAAAIAVAAIIASSFLPRLRQPGPDQFLATQLIASHVRSLMAAHLTDVASSDQHTVKPWLDTKLDFAPPVVDLSSDGFPLVGGRLDYLDNRPVAALVYGRRKHFINLFVWPAASDEAKAPKTITREGYQLLHWADSDFNYWAVSDVNVNDLQLFKQQFETRTPRH